MASDDGAFLTALTTLYDVGGQGQESLPGGSLAKWTNSHWNSSARGRAAALGA